MILRRHTPCPALARFVDFFWCYEDWTGDHAMERVLPDGTFELVINLLDGPRRLFDRGDTSRSTSFRGGWLSGTHSQYIVIDAVQGASMIGAHFKPGGAGAFVAPPASEFQDQVIDFESLWGSRARAMRQQLLEAPSPGAKFQILEQFLTDSLTTPAKRARQIAWATEQLCWQSEVPRISNIAGCLGMSHKHFIQEFREQIGLAPKLFCRIRRFQKILQQINAGQRLSWAQIACDCGYYDQAHLVNDFQAFAGLNPSAYRGLQEDYASFVAIKESR